ncbi:MAG: fatty acid--CoA ligase, partial [Thermogemmatispora sp.]|nr:fatty acid--CoA ligase [Thermogemmatispora sp.]
DPDGYIQLVDRTKDLVKSGGEWISSVELENLIMGHPKVLEACVVGVPHPKWSERPLACVVPKPEFAGQVSAEEILEFLRPKVAKWWLPDEVIFVEAIPKTSVGKFDKKVLRAQYESRLASQS